MPRRKWATIMVYIIRKLDYGLTGLWRAFTRDVSRGANAQPFVVTGAKVNHVLRPVRKCFAAKSESYMTNNIYTRQFEACYRVLSYTSETGTPTSTANKVQRTGTPDGTVVFRTKAEKERSISTSQAIRSSRFGNNGRRISWSHGTQVSSGFARTDLQISATADGGTRGRRFLPFMYE